METRGSSCVRAGPEEVKDLYKESPPSIKSPRQELRKQNPSCPDVETPKWPRKQPFRPNILVMKGGGVKGIAYVGALEVLEEYVYRFNHFVGTSAGAITGALLAVGYKPGELGSILEKTNFKGSNLNQAHLNRASINNTSFLEAWTEFIFTDTNTFGLVLL